MSRVFQLNLWSVEIKVQRLEIIALFLSARNLVLFKKDYDIVRSSLKKEEC